MKKMFLLIETCHKRGENRDLKEVLGCFETYKEADDAMMKTITRINNGEWDGIRHLTYKNADWNLIAFNWGANEPRGYVPRYVTASVYEDGKRYGDLYIDVREIEVGVLY